MATTTKTKAPANYRKLAEETELIKFGLEAKVAQVKANLNRMLKDVPERAAIMVSFERLAHWQCSLTEVTERYDRYVSLRDRDVSTNSEKSSDS